MADFGTDSRGGIDDRVRLNLGGDDVLIAESYEVRASILSQPAQFSLRLGQGSLIAPLLEKYPPYTPFKLYIGTVLQQTGFIDGLHAEGSTGATELTITGQDALMVLHRNEIEAEISLNDDTYTSLTKRALTACGLDPNNLVTSAQADRNLRTGVRVTETGEPTSPDQVITDNTTGTDDSTTTIGVVTKKIQTRLGERWFEFVRRYLDRAGLFLWAGADGKFILSAPNPNQKPVYKIVRRRGQDRNAVNVITASFSNDTRGRHTVAVICGRSGGGKHGRAKAITATTDDEMVNWTKDGIGTGTQIVLVVRDANVHTNEQADFLGHRKIAEERRSGYQISYTLSGHTTPTIGGKSRAVWAPDTIVSVEDDEFGINDDFWIESVEYRRGPETTTTIRLMRKIDLVFGSTESDVE